VRDPNLTPDPNRIRDFLQQVEARSRARSQFERARLGNESLLDWLDRTYQQTSQKGESLSTIPGDEPHETYSNYRTRR
jgi:hypothetical protein